MGLNDNANPGQPRPVTKADFIALENYLEQSPHQAQLLPSLLQERAELTTHVFNH